MSPELNVLERAFSEHPDLDHALALAEAYLADHRLMEAMVVCKKGLRTAPHSPNGLLMLSRIYLVQGKLPKAEEIALELLAHPDMDADACHILGSAAFQRGNKAHAAQWFHRGLDSSPMHSGLTAGLAQLGPSYAEPPPKHPTKHRSMEALELVKELEIADAPESVAEPKPVHAQTVTSYERDLLDDYDGGTPRNTTVPPDYSKTWRSVAILAAIVAVIGAGMATHTYLKAKDQHEVSKSLAAIVNALASDRVTDYQDVMMHADRVLHIVPLNTLASAQGAYAAAVLAIDHAKRDAVPAIARFLGNIPPNTLDLPAEYYAAQMMLSFLRGRFSEGLELQDPFTASRHPHVLIAMERHRLLTANGATPREVQDQIMRLGAMKGKNFRVLMYLGWHALALEENQRALSYFEEVLKKQPDHVLAKLGIALVRAIGSSTPIEPAERKAIIEITDDVLHSGVGLRSPRAMAIAHFILGLLAERGGDKATASQEMALAMPALNNEGTFHWIQGLQSIQIGRFRTAARALAEVVKHNPQSTKAWLLLAQAQLDDASPSSAKASLAQALQLGAQTTPYVQLLEGRIQLGNRHFEEAVATLGAIPADADPAVRAQSVLAIAEALSSNKQHLEAAAKLTSLLNSSVLDIPPHMHAVLWCMLGVEETYSGQSSSAVVSLNRGIAYDPNYALCYFPLCTLSHDRNACETYLRLDPEGPHAKVVARVLSKVH